MGGLTVHPSTPLRLTLRCGSRVFRLGHSHPPKPNNVFTFCDVLLDCTRPTRETQPKRCGSRLPFGFSYDGRDRIIVSERWLSG